jgi:hypothetical protein
MSGRKMESPKKEVAVVQKSVQIAAADTGKN